VRRAILLVLDGCGAGAAPDWADYGDAPGAATVRNVWERCGGLKAPNLEEMGFLAACGVGTAPSGACWARLLPEGRGKDSVTGHWEMMGAVVREPFPTYPHGFPADLVGAFEREIGRRTLANRPASGTQIIEELGEESMRTGRPILYTSADSVFQLAAHESVVPVDQLYDWCRIARRLCLPPHGVQRVIARPFAGEPGAFQRTARRRDFPMEPPPNLVDEIGGVLGIGVVPELFAGRGFIPMPRTQSNREHFIALMFALESGGRFIFANFEDTDMLFGHRSDPEGFGRCLEEFDAMLAQIRARLGEDDLLLITADHGNDPTDESTDHTREFLPLASNQPLGSQKLFEVGVIIKAWING
jgi:phosphopentomutase